jgi:hypothetical protein
MEITRVNRITDLPKRNWVCSSKPESEMKQEYPRAQQVWVVAGTFRGVVHDVFYIPEEDAR